MGLFYRRPLCFFAFLFVAFSLFAFFSPTAVALWGFRVLAVVLFAGICGLIFLKKKRVLCLTAVISLAVAMLAVAHSLLFVTLPMQKAERFAGEHTFVAEIVREKYRDDDYARLSVRLVQIDGEATDIPATVTLYSHNEFSPNDRIAARGELLPMGEKDRDGDLLWGILDEETEIYYQANSQRGASWARLLLSPSGIVTLSQRCQSALREYMISHLGEESGALAAAFFVGDRSALSASAVRDFGRAGVSHLMAVSGLHFSVLLGALDLLLRKLLCPKKGRIVIVTIGSVFFLFLTGFSMSACRSALMLYALYINFLFQEEADSITSLFCSFALIVLISPLAITDVGLWMSFLATLGLLTLYPMISEKIPRPSVKNILWRKVLLLLRETLMLVLMTVIATLFLLPVLWVLFGEISIVSLLANPILSVLSYPFLVGIPIWLLLSPIPLVGQGLGFILSFFSDAILSLTAFFSHLPSPALSLNYRFCDLLIPIFAVGMIAVLVLRFRRRWLALIPPIAVILAFSVCFCVVRFSERTPSVCYLSTLGHHEALWVSDGDEAAICDLSGGAPWLYGELRDKLSSSTATEFSSLVLTTYTQRHSDSLGEFLTQEVVRTLYLPLPHDREEQEIAAELWRIATDAGSEVVFYGDGVLLLTDSVSVEISILASEAFAVALTVRGAETSLSYVTPSYLKNTETKELEARLGKSQTILVGGYRAKKSDGFDQRLVGQGSAERVIYCTEERYGTLSVVGAEQYAATDDVWTWEFSLP